jgi:hypothetical protein
MYSRSHKHTNPHARRPKEEPLWFNAVTSATTGFALALFVAFVGIMVRKGVIVL